MTTENKIKWIIVLAIALPLIPGLIEVCIKVEAYTTGIFIIIALIWVTLWVIAGILKLLVMIKNKHSKKKKAAHQIAMKDERKQRITQTDIRM